MSNQVKHELNKIEIPKELHERSKMGVSKAKSEMKNRNRRWYLAAPVAVAALAFLLLSPSQVHEFIPGEPSLKVVSQSNAYDTSDPRKLVGFSDNVFIGKVVEQSGTKALNEFPETQFAVEVIENIKGDLTGTVTVNQQGGYQWNELVLYEGDTLLEEGKTYLFATRYLESENWNTVIPVDGDLPIGTEEEKAQLIQTYTKAYENEIPFEVGN